MCAAGVFTEIVSMRIQSRRVCACLCFSILGSAMAALAQPAAPTAALSLREALDRTLERNPELVALGYGRQGVEGQLQQSRLKPNPDLHIAVQDVLGTDRFEALDSAETTVSLEWVLERGVRQRMVAAAQSGLEAYGAEVEVHRLDEAAETARRYVECLLLQARLLTRAEGVRLAEQTVGAVRRRVDATRAPQAELARAEAELARAEILEEDVEHELLSAYRELSAQWGEPQPSFATVAGEIGPLPTLDPFEALIERVDANPALLRFASQQRLDEAQLRLEQARSRPSWRVSGGLRRFEATDDQALVAGLTVPLAWKNRNQGRIAEARANVARTGAEAAAARVDIETSLFVLYQELKHDVDVAGRLTRDIIPRIDTALDGTRRLYEAGGYSYLELALVQSQLLDAREELLSVTADAHTLVIEIERLTGVSVARSIADRGNQP
jgi:outer membrane protein, heavy metal efflux system